MSWYVIITFVSIAICVILFLYNFIIIFRKEKPADYSTSFGKEKQAVIYAYTGAMNPWKKESAYYHMPTYTAGIIYHVGSFLALPLMILFLTGINIYTPVAVILSFFLIISGLSGLGILLKRIMKKEMRLLSNADDYISNILVSGFQLITSFTLIFANEFYFVFCSVLLIYMPIGKLKHSIYFFAARYHLGIFYGRRGVWPPEKQ